MRWIAVLPFLLLVQCGRDTGAWAGAVETLPNGAVRVTNPELGIWGEDGGWRLVPELSFGEGEGPPGAYLFGQIAALEVSRDGRIYVLDRQAKELRIFGPGGEHLRTVGRAGAGPGEYAAPNGLVWLADDSLVVVDQQGARYSILDADGDFVRSVPREVGFWGWMFNGGLADGRIYEFAPVRHGAEHRTALVGTPLRSPGEGAAGARSQVQDTIPLSVLEGPTVEPYTASSGGSSMMLGVPFSPSALYRLDRHGNVWLGHNSELRLVRTSLAGDTAMEIVGRGQAVPVSAEEIREFEESSGAARLREMGGTLDLGRIPRTKPHFDGLFLDDEENLWLSVPSAPDRTVFAVFDRDGRFLGRLTLEGVRAQQFVQPVVRNGRLHLVALDEADVPRVVVFRIER